MERENKIVYLDVVVQSEPNSEFGLLSTKCLGQLVESLFTMRPNFDKILALDFSLPISSPSVNTCIGT